jgi:RNA polymerase sigma factor (sigma-70 family)
MQLVDVRGGGCSEGPDLGTTAPPQQVGGSLVADLIRKHQRHLHALVKRRMGRAIQIHHSAEDLVQEAIVEALTMSDRFKYFGDPAFLEWIGCIVTRVIARSLPDPRFVSVALLQSGESATGGISEEELPGKERTPSSIVAKREHLSKLRGALNRISPKQQEALWLYKYQDWPLSRMAHHLSCGKGTICSYVARATEVLRGLFK